MKISQVLNPIYVGEFYLDKKHDRNHINISYNSELDNKLLTSLKGRVYLFSSDGVIICHQPSNLHPFSILNRILPHDLKEKVLQILLPWSKRGARGWESYYHKCNYFGFKKLCEKNNLKIVSEKFNYNASH